MPSRGFSQSGASEWFKKGMATTSPDMKIEAFKKAVQRNPDYVEAYFYLGLAYKSKQMYKEAELTLNKAYFKNPYTLNKEIKTRILFELGAIYLRTGKLAQAGDALKGAKGLTAKTDKLRGWICYELGRVYIQENRVNLALTELYEGLTLLPQQANLFGQTIDLANSKKQISEKYEAGIRLMGEEKYEAAIKKLDFVISEDPNFLDVRIKLREAQTALQQLQQTKRLLGFYEKAVKKSNLGSVQEAIMLLRQVVAIDPNFKNSILLLQNLEEKGRNLIAGRQPRSLAEASSRKSLPSPSANTPSLPDRTIQEKRRAERLNETAQTPKPQTTQIQKLQSKKVKQKKGVDVDSLYQLGVAGLQNGEWLEAILAFEKVKILNPDYEGIDNKLADARFNMERNNASGPQNAAASKSSYVTLIGSVISIIFLPLGFGFLVFSPGTRARLYLIRGDYEKACHVYERALLKNPGKIRVYPLLANIYLLENRRDEQALKVYEAILRLNIYTRKREKINSIVADHYLTQGRLDPNAIEVMEKELHTRIKINGGI